MSKIIVDLEFANLVAESYDNGTPLNDIAVYLQDKTTGEVVQDIASVRQSIKNEETNEVIPKTVEFLVWTDKNSEDYTQKFRIEMHEEE